MTTLQHLPMRLRQTCATLRAGSAVGRLFSTSMAQRESYGFIGLGAMGYPMAQNLRKGLTAEDTLVVYDVRGEVAQQFTSEKVEGAGKVEAGGDVEEVLGKANTMITMLPTGSHVRTVFSSLLHNLTPPPPGTPKKLFLDSSTIDVSTSQSVSNALYPHGTFLDTPVSGGVPGAQAATLSFLVGLAQTSPLFPRVSAILQLMGKRIFPCGPQGAGIAAKLANNYILAVTNIAVCEGVNLGTRLGLDPDVLMDVVNASSGRCWSSEVNSPVRRFREDFKGGFKTALMGKDLKLALEAAGEVGAKLPMGDKAVTVYDSAEATEGCEGRDFSVVYKWLGGKA